jgi:hypothetical protein
LKNTDQFIETGTPHACLDAPRQPVSPTCGAEFCFKSDSSLISMRSTHGKREIEPAADVQDAGSERVDAAQATGVGLGALDG